jgi:hypothetical protein
MKYFRDSKGRFAKKSVADYTLIRKRQIFNEFGETIGEELTFKLPETNNLNYEILNMDGTKRSNWPVNWEAFATSFRELPEDKKQYYINLQDRLFAALEMKTETKTTPTFIQKVKNFFNDLLRKVV